MEEQGGSQSYPECKDKPKISLRELTPEEVFSLPPSDQEAVLPLFECKISNYKRQQQCSLQTNEFLKCRWKSYIHNRQGMQTTPFKLANLSHLHFHNYGIKYMPSLSPKEWKTYKMRLHSGPGIDQHGQMPIPADIHVSQTKTPKPKEEHKPLESSKSKK